MKAVSNAGPLMVLGKLRRLNLLRIYDEVLIPRAVYDEVVIQGKATHRADAYVVETAVSQGQIVVVDLAEADLSPSVRELPLDKGERHAIALAQQEQADFVLLDDLKAREEARRLGLSVKGSLGIIADAYRQQMLSFEDTSALFEEIIVRDDIWISEALCRHVLAGLRK